MKAKRKNRQLKQLKLFAKNYQITLSPIIRTNLLSSPEGISIVTEHACIRPDIYLDNGRNCEGCPYFISCACDIKRLKKKKGH
jgi:hypothetical protein